MTRNFKRFVLCFAIVFLATLASCALPFISRIEPQLLNKLVVTSGVGDASRLDIDGKSGIALSGEWEFYRNKYISSANDDYGEPDLYIQVPSSWSDYSIDGVKLQNGGSASYRAIIKGVRASKDITVSVPDIPGACRAYINGECVYTNRRTGFTFLDTNDEFRPEAKSIRIDGEADCEIVIEMDCNYSCGLTSVPMLMTYDAYVHSNGTMTSILFLFIGMVLLFGVLTITLSIMTKDAYKRFWLVALCVIFIFKLLISETGYTIAQPLFFDLNFEVMTALSFALTYIIKLAMMMHTVTDLRLNVKTGTIIFVAMVFLLCAFVPYFFYEEIYIANIFMWLQSVTYVFDAYMVWKICGAVIDKKKFSLLYLLSYCVTAGAIILDNFGITGYVSRQVAYVVPVSCVIFIMCAIIVHSFHTVEAFKAQQRAVILTQELADVNMKLMLSQIQPHFLYNALNVIKHLVKKDPKTAEKAIVKFSNYLRANMDSLTQDEPIPFTKELDHVKNYADIEQIRFGDRLKLVFYIRADNFTVPPLTLQPIVENAIKHGVNQKLEGGTVKVSSWEETDKFVITVEDDGVGFNPEEKKNDGVSHVGITNIKIRLKQWLNATVDVKSEIGVGTLVTVNIPKGEVL